MREEQGQILSDVRDVIRINAEAFRRQELVQRELVTAIRELREESRANSKAIFTLIDRLGGGPATAT